jgi:hypothetical protein
MRVIIAILSLLIAAPSYADTIVKYGVNVSREDEKLGSTKAIFIADQAPILGPIIRQYEIGGWVDNTGKPGQRSSLLGGASAGIHVNAGYLYAQALVGPSLISAPDSALGGHFQFNNDIALGLRDPDTKATIGLSYKHVSSAGLERPNRGRDFIMFRVSLPW